jgi:hypothetical protein
MDQRPAKDSKHGVELWNRVRQINLTTLLGGSRPMEPTPRDQLTTSSSRVALQTSVGQKYGRQRWRTNVNFSAGWCCRIKCGQQI